MKRTHQSTTNKSLNKSSAKPVSATSRPSTQSKPVKPTSDHSIRTDTIPSKSFKHTTFNWLSAGHQPVKPSDQTDNQSTQFIQREIAEYESTSAVSLGYGQGHPKTTYYLNHPRTHHPDDTKPTEMSNQQLRSILASSLGYGRRHDNFAAYVMRPEFDRNQVMGITRSVPISK